MAEANKAMARATRFVRQAARWLDRQPLPLVAAAGVVLGLGIGLPGFLYLQSRGWVVLWGALFVALWRLGRSAEPVFEEEFPAITRPRRVRDGPFVMMGLPGGSFWMGSPDTDSMADDNEKPPHQVTVSGFRIAVTPVAAAVYHEVMQGEAPPQAQGQLPAVDVSWYDAVQFCNKLSQREGYRPCYRQKFGRWVCDWRADGYRLPTEAEWEYACRAGTTTRYSFGDNPERLGRYAWFGEEFSGQAYEVAQKLPNPWGLYDIHGNVWEWCWDWYESYTAKPARNPHNPEKFISNTRWRVVRGGSFGNSPAFLRSARRTDFRPEFRGSNIGFRCVRLPPQRFD